MAPFLLLRKKSACADSNLGHGFGAEPVKSRRLGTFEFDELHRMKRAPGSPGQLVTPLLRLFEKHIETLIQIGSNEKLIFACQ